MKKLTALFAGLFLLLLSFNAPAQTAPAKDYFVAKWDLLMEGLPQGDPRLIVDLQRKDGKLTGTILDSTSKEIAKITRVEETPTTVTVYFTAQDYDVNLAINKKDEDHVTASLLGMFEGKGVRMKETK
ncbi:hypothetical protein [Segetibacter sp.]|jgi:hypothetical protein|uniref:hypothetical protein n=1 Tax=Segetibacter sp. TaxID=2231182 RepID=UPI00262721A8|nr:hypothetical protein [Segetibacter sp.]MCW3081618.1 hypothetical protein [Segetibacter sp.]